MKMSHVKAPRTWLDNEWLSAVFGIYDDIPVLISLAYIFKIQAADRSARLRISDLSIRRSRHSKQ